LTGFFAAAACAAGGAAIRLPARAGAVASALALIGLAAAGIG